MIKNVIQRLVNVTLNIRDKKILEKLKSLVRSYSTQIATLIENLISEFYVKCKKNRIMSC